MALNAARSSTKYRELHFCLSRGEDDIYPASTRHNSSKAWCKVSRRGRQAPVATGFIYGKRASVRERD